MPREHPFDRYVPFTDVAALKEWSAKPLRKSVRVNMLKCSIERFREWAKRRGWAVEQVPWCEEGFFVERETREEALGKDLLHLIGGFYIQEAASMLPVTLLDPQPGEAVLDMSAAPGSKATQIVTRMARVTPSVVEGRRTLSGVVVANDIQEHRLWTLKSALHRCGVTNAVVTKKVGQWFGKHMTERFDRVLCDAPCTAQGAARKDSDALTYSGPENVATMARLQEQLLEAAIHAAKVGGRIIYSTCTLTPEENEGVVGAVVEKYGGKVEMIDPRSMGLETGNWDIGRAVKDSFVVQQHVRGPRPEVLVPLLRLWPQTFDTEGFFCAVLRKIAPTRPVEPMERVSLVEDRVPPERQRHIAALLEEQYGTSFMGDGEVLLQSSEQLFLVSEEVADFPLPVRDYAVGLPFAKLLADGPARRSPACPAGGGGGGRMRLSHEMATLRGTAATRMVVSVSDEQLSLLLAGKDAPGDLALHGDVLLLYEGFCIGRALAKAGIPAEALSNVERAKGGILKNNLPRWMVR